MLDQTYDYSGRSAKADPFSHVRRVKKIQPTRSIDLVPASTEATIHRLGGGAAKKVADERQAQVAGRIAVVCSAASLLLEDFIDIGWGLEQSVYADKGSWARAVRVVMGQYPQYDNDAERSHAVVDGLVVMERTCDLIKELSS